MIHPTAQVDTTHIGPETRVWQHAVILEGARIGNFCNINCHTFIENNVTIGDYVTVKSGVYLWDGLIVEDHVFIGPNATFVNNRYPRSNMPLDPYPVTVLEAGCSVGAGAIIMDGIRVGRCALIAAGAVVSRDVPDHALVKGNPAVRTGWVDDEGMKLEQQGSTWTSPSGLRYEEIDGKLIKQTE